MELIKCQVALMVIFITSNCSIHGANIQENKFESDSPLLFKEEFFEAVPRIKDPTDTTLVLGGNKTEITHGTVKWIFIYWHFCGSSRNCDFFSLQGGTQTSDGSPALLPSPRCKLPRRWKKFPGSNRWRCVRCPRQKQWVYTSNKQWVCR